MEQVFTSEDLSVKLLTNWYKRKKEVKNGMFEFKKIKLQELL